MNDPAHQRNRPRPSHPEHPDNDLPATESGYGELPPLPSRSPVGDRAAARSHTRPGDDRSAEIAVLERVAAAIRALPLELDRRHWKRTTWIPDVCNARSIV